ncbi:MAG: DUF1993 domain-containing protein [Hyphomonadaceae bacterium]|nr:DUF1993 domain-containing protein [Hyphomonadaceae bacterium]
MSQVSMHAFSAPTFARMLRNLSAMLAKAEAHAKAKNFDPAVLLNDRLAPDMFTLTRQVQIATDHAKGAMARLAGKQPEVIPDTDTTIADLQARIAKVIAIVESITPAQLEGADKREISIKIPNQELKFSGIDYLNGWALPNFYFHMTMAYAILRHNGVELGKRDFLMS